MNLNILHIHKLIKNIFILLINMINESHLSDSEITNDPIP